VPRLAADCCTVFLRQGGHQEAESLNSVLLDQAPAHVAQRVALPQTGSLGWLPADSPELTPVERLWEDLQSRLDVQPPSSRSNLQGLREPIAGLVRDYTAEPMASLTGYSYLVEAACAL
jgi:hypothetical protein